MRFLAHATIHPLNTMGKAATDNSSRRYSQRAVIRPQEYQSRPSQYAVLPANQFQGVREGDEVGHISPREPLAGDVSTQTADGDVQMGRDAGS